MPLTLNPTQAWTCINALNAAATLYDQDAHGCPQLAEQFEKQAKQARALAELIEEEAGEVAA
jgi:hypothetical protein